MSLINSSGGCSAEFSEWWVSSNDKSQEEANTFSCWDSHTMSFGGLCRDPCVGSSRHDKWNHYYLSATRTSSGRCVPESELGVSQTRSQSILVITLKTGVLSSLHRAASWLLRWQTRGWRKAAGTAFPVHLHPGRHETRPPGTSPAVILIQKQLKSNLEDHPINIYCLKGILSYLTTKANKISLLLLWKLWKFYCFSLGICGKTGSSSMTATASLTPALQGGMSVELELKFCGLGNKSRGADHMGPVLFRNSGEL